MLSAVQPYSTHTHTQTDVHPCMHRDYFVKVTAGAATSAKTQTRATLQGKYMMEMRGKKRKEKEKTRGHREARASDKYVGNDACVPLLK